MTGMGEESGPPAARGGGPLKNRGIPSGGKGMGKGGGGCFVKKSFNMAALVAGSTFAGIGGGRCLKNAGSIGGSRPDFISMANCLGSNGGRVSGRSSRVCDFTITPFEGSKWKYRNLGFFCTKTGFSKFAGLGVNGGGGGGRARSSSRICCSFAAACERRSWC